MLPLRLMLCGAVAAGAIVLGACGDESSNELRSGEAGSLRAALSEVEQRVGAQDCTGASQQAAAFRDRVDELPQRVDSDLRRALASSADRLATLVADQCAAEPTVQEPDVGTTSPDQGQGNDENQGDGQTKDTPPDEENPNPDETQTQPDSGGSGEEVPPVGDQGGGTPPEE
jgi:hypothetical protein